MQSPKDSTKKQIAVALSAASFAISSKFEEDNFSADDSNQSATEDAREAGAALAESLIEDAKDADQEQIVRGLSMVANIDRIADSLDQNSPALKDVVTPDEPAQQKVMAVSPIDQTLKLSNRITKNIKKAVQMMNPGIKNTNQQLYGDLWQQFELDQSNRAFFSTANTRVENDQSAYAQFLYNDLKYSGKESTPEGAIARVQDNYRYTL